MTAARASWSRVVLALVGVAALGAVIWQYQRHVDKTEPLWQADATHYDHRPVLVYFDDNDFREYLPTIAASFDLWNRALGCNGIARAADLLEADVILRPLSGIPCGKDWDKDDANMYTCYEPPGAVVEVRRIDDVGLALVELDHEWGHAAFGLADRNAGDIMSALKQPEPGDPPPATWITPFLAGAVKGRMCR